MPEEIELHELAEVSDEYREGISAIATGLNMTLFAAAVLDEDVGPEKLMEAAVRDVSRIYDIPKDAAREVLAYGMPVQSAVSMIKRIGEAAMAPEADPEDFC